MLRVGCVAKTLWNTCLDAFATHQMLHSLSTDLPACFHQVQVNSRTPVGFTACRVKPSDLRREPGILLSSLRGFTATPSVVAGTRNLENSTRDSDRPDRLLRVDELVPHEFSLAKKAVAFFSISRSSRRRLFSRRKVVSSERSSRRQQTRFPTACVDFRLPDPTPHSCFRQIHFTANDADALVALATQTHHLCLVLQCKPSSRSFVIRTLSPISVLQRMSTKSGEAHSRRCGPSSGWGPSMSACSA